MGWASLLTIVGSIWATIASIKYFFLISFRIDENTFKTFYEKYKDNKRQFIFNEEMITYYAYPSVYSSFYFLSNLPIFWLSHSERLLTAGGSSKENITVITCFRWKKKILTSEIMKLIEESQLKEIIPIEIVKPYYLDKLGVIDRKFLAPLLDNEIWEDIEQDFVKAVVNKEKNKTGAILYGPPGNGKTTFIKYLAQKYKVPIRILSFDASYNNLDIMKMFSNIRKDCIVLFEDFDSYFDQRQNLLKDPKFTFDSILNGMDGIYNTYTNVAFYMTVNDITKVDIALKDRPSRFSFVREFTNPSKRLMDKYGITEEGLSLDKLLFHAKKIGTKENI